ncbi:MAG: DUF3160 domain-containing protein, partial [Clostridia bacterium]|nr:DUF3160 domain-containing protein [Clostridia bacterium]
MQWHTKRSFIWLLLLIFTIVIIGGCNEVPQLEADKDVLADYALTAYEFAPYKEVTVNEKPNLKPYKIDPKLQNVENADRFVFSQDAQDILVKNGFVVLPGHFSEFFMVYEFNRYDVVPNFITTDAMLHNYHLFFEHLLKTVEEEQLIPELKKLNKGMVEVSQEHYKLLRNTVWENAAKRNLAFFTVASLLTDPQSVIPAGVEKEVQAELKLIKAQNATAISPVMKIGQNADLVQNLKEDYTQYIPRGHYTRSEELKSYFQTMMWYGRMTFRHKDEDETRSALLMTVALQNEANQKAWEKIYQTTDFFVGSSDDLGFYEYQEIAQKVYGTQIKLAELKSDGPKWVKFREEVLETKGPAINSIPIFDAQLQPDRDREISGFRFMGQRYTIDADIFQRLIYREVGENPQGERRLLPKGLDIPAALGSAAAESILKDMGEYQYQDYPQQMGKMQKYLKELEKDNWHQNLYWNWIYTLKPLAKDVPTGYPSFMLNSAWARKQLTTFLGSWTELKHDTILYAKQVYAEMGGGGIADYDDRGYVEPNPHLYGRLAALSALTRDGLLARGLISERDTESLERMEELALKLKTISEKELQGSSLTDEEYDLIRTFGGQLEHFWMEALRDQGSIRGQLLNDNPAALVADVATSPPNEVLEEATGRINIIFAAVPVDGKLR